MSKKQYDMYVPCQLKIIIAALLISTLASCGGSDSKKSNSDNIGALEKDEHLSAGDATGFTTSGNAFSDSSANLPIKQLGDFRAGNSFFEKPWVSAPASTTVRDGVGPLFNVIACQSCHIKDGRGHAPNHGETDFTTLLIRTAKSNITQSQKADMRAGRLAKVPDSTVGGQIQDRSNSGVVSEASMKVTYEPVKVTFADGFTVNLRKPTWHLTNNYASKNDGKFDTDTIFSARMSPAMIGLGLLQAIKETDIKNQADPNDNSKNGISGRYNIVKDVVTGKSTLGRFGWKAGEPNIAQQSAGAFNEDMGLTTRMFKKPNCMPNQTDCLTAPNGNGHGMGNSIVNYDYEVRDMIFDQVVLYAKNLAVPIRRNHDDTTVLKGKKRFYQLGCVSCHTPKYVTAEQPKKMIAQSKQKIYPYTDMLLHDMGTDLADFSLVYKADGTQGNIPQSDDLVEFGAQANEWRTQPLWGIGLAQTVSPQANFLHDGRARTIMEAVLWHGGEAESVKQKVLQLDSQGRKELQAFLDSL